MACPMAPSAGFLRNYLNWFFTSMAWLVADWFGWRAALSVYPPLLRNKVAIVTGANAGLGLETTKALLQQGATVVMACRSMQAAATARQEILADARNAGPVPDAAGRLILLHVDFEDFATIPKFVEDFHATGLPLHLLVNNAGIHLKPHKKVSCGFERTIASNFFGHFWLTQLLLDDLKAAAPSRIVEMSSFVENFGLLGLYTRTLPWHDLRGATLPDSGERAYTLSKTYILMAARELARRLEGSGVDVITVHPGFADSTWYLKSDNNAYLFSWLVAKVRSVVPWLGVGQPCTTGAISTIYAAIAPELQGSTSSVASKGVVDSICRALFGGRLKYFGPHYIIQNCFNAFPRWATNPWNYNKGACVRMYESALDLIQQVQQEMGMQQQQQQQPAGGVGQGVGAGAAGDGAGLPAGKEGGAIDGSRKRKGGAAAVVNGYGEQPVPAA
eukprot:GHRQ01000963.1.p1 GENE.GHRQ01000963.1~~GHRQ01000963.1.p1  ORF type:complete len:445 (+),score=210.22 GHRQ01000963.1:166-1500(+)